MGNTHTSRSSTQSESPLGLMNEDTILCILKHLELRDFARLMRTCREYLHTTLGPNNYFWAQLCNNFPTQKQLWNEAPQQPIPLAPMTNSRHYPVMQTPVLYPRSINHLLSSVQEGRKWIVDGNVLDLQKTIIDPVNKHLVSHFNIKDELKRYFFKHILAPRLAPELIAPFSTNANILVHAVSYSGDFTNYWTKMDITNHQYARDYYFQVNLSVSPEMYDQLHSIPAQKSNRLVLYAKSDTPAVRLPEYNYMDRRQLLPQPPQMPPQYYQQMEQLHWGPPIPNPNP